ncbi:MAG: choice-of-anchor D domain-containing protein [Deltaproteobacteria bacterium]|nr:choice-of-anchor D domain-containing protein [Deltaproteobacteria bacterium]
MRKIWVVCLLLAGLASGCGEGGDTKTIFFVRILQGTAPDGITRIDLEVQKDATTFMVPLEATGGGALTLPITREVKLPDDQSGAVIVTATARNAAGDNVGVGRAPATIVPGETITLELEFGKDLTLTDGGLPDGEVPTEAQLSITPTDTDYGPVVLGQTRSVTFTVQNSGQQSSGLVNLAVGGRDQANFSITAGSNCIGASLSPGASCSVDVVFNPSAVGVSMGSVSASATPGGTATALLTGTAAFGDSIMIAPTTRDFGAVVLGSSSAATTFTITNTGGTATPALTTAISGTNAADFVRGTDTCAGAMVGPGLTCTIAVTFTPGSSGARSAALTVTSTAGPAAVSLTGTGLSQAALTITPATQALGNVVQNTTASTTFTVRNTGGTATGALSVVRSGASAAETSTSGCTAALAAGASCTLTATLTPTTLGAKSTTITVMGTPGGSAVATLTATAVAPGALTVTPTSANFGALLLNTDSGAQSFTVRNTGGAPTGVPTASLTGSAAGDYRFSANGCTAALAPNATCTVSIIFRPSLAGGRGAAFEITASPGGLASASLSGTGQRPAALSASATTQPFGTIDVGSASSPFTWTISNTGDVASGVPTLTPTGATTQYTITNNCTAAIGAGSSCTVVVTFRPTTGGTANLSLSLTASPGGTVALSATGTGRPLSLLTVTVNGNGAGTVTSSPVGINCSSGTCTQSYVATTTVTLSANPNTTTSVFSGWMGDCTGTGSCMVSMAAARNVTATYTLRRYTLSVTPAPTAPSSVATFGSAGIACPGDCTQGYDHGSAVVLRAAPGADRTFTGWGYAGCPGTGDCNLTMTGNVTLAPTFTLTPYPVAVTINGGPGGVLVTSSPGGISCAPTCSANFPYSSSVTLTPTGASGYRMVWGTGPCAGSTGACTFAVPSGGTSARADYIEQRTVTVTPLGGGASAVAYLDGSPCAGSCVATYDVGASVRVDGEADLVNARYQAMTGAGTTCSGFDPRGESCRFTVASGTNYTVNVLFQSRLSVLADLGVRVIEQRLNLFDCFFGSTTCEGWVNYNAAVDITYQLHFDPGNVQLVDWGGLCNGTPITPLRGPEDTDNNINGGPSPTSCRFRVTTPGSATLKMYPSYRLHRFGSANGVVFDTEVDPDGAVAGPMYLSCVTDGQQTMPGSVCNPRVPYGRRWLVARPDPGHIFGNWDAPCQARRKHAVTGDEYCLIDIPNDGRTFDVNAYASFR